MSLKRNFVHHMTYRHWLPILSNLLGSGLWLGQGHGTWDRGVGVGLGPGLLGVFDPFTFMSKRVSEDIAEILCKFACNRRKHSHQSSGRCLSQSQSHQQGWQCSCNSHSCCHLAPRFHESHQEKSLESLYCSILNCSVAVLMGCAIFIHIYI